MDTDWSTLFRRGVLHFGLTPETFWRLSWREWQMLNAASAPAQSVLPRAALDDLMTQFPDKSP